MRFGAIILTDLIRAMKPLTIQSAEIQRKLSGSGMSIRKQGGEGDGKRQLCDECSGAMG